ncbi:ATP-binding protein [Kitasatospora sp. NPDC059599]|uniref:ATP-binding protein n=1 Tax=Kitasatospora sp. NPDC059599 TaxID=3346880 RepID=UPI0036A5D74D
MVDNCEHLVDAVAHLITALLTRCAELRVLATSREPLAVDGEALVPLGPLALPAPRTGIEQARRTASVRLFAERAAAVRPGFAVDGDNLGEVLRVVHSLDGMPLALELAAARLRTLPLAGLAAGLSDRFHLLTTDSRTARPRHRTLRAVIAWSWDLLDPDARAVVERISVLSGGVTAVSAAAVCAGTHVPAADVPELLAGLVDRSLLQLTPDTGRYRMLETIRAYGLERLAEHGALTDARERAARHFADLVARQDPLLRGPRQLDALRVLRTEHDNVLAALRHLCAPDAPDAPDGSDTADGASDDAVDLAVNLTWYWQMLGRHTDAAHWLRAATRSPVARPSAERAVAAGLLALTAAAPGTPAGGLTEERRDERGEDQHDERREEQRDALRALADRLPREPGPTGAGGVLAAAGLALLLGTELPPVLLRPSADTPDTWSTGLARLLRAQFAENEGRLDQARGDVDAALDCFAGAGDRWGVAKALPLRALLRQYDGDLDGALADLNEAKRLAATFGSLSISDEVFVDLRLVDLHAGLGDTTRAAALIAEARERALRSASPETAVLLSVREAALRAQSGDLARAGDLLGSAETGLAQQALFDLDQGQALIGTVRGTIQLARGDGPAAERSLRRAYTAALGSGDMPIVATVAVGVAGLAALRGRHRDTATLLGAAARLRGAHDRTDPQIRTLTARSRAVLGDERFTEAYEAGRQLDVPTALSRADPARLRREPSLGSPANPAEPGAG